MVSDFTSGSGLVRSGSFSTRQNLHHPIFEGKCMFPHRGVHTQDLFLDRFLRVCRTANSLVGCVREHGANEYRVFSNISGAQPPETTLSSVKSSGPHGEQFNGN